ncbi:hypothetical protein Q5H92_06510 [Hymenobacter sp. M29]|uniref:Uncharacterized protein n=1 Tax=Hymenobacter mellowenesis TaxID=3063995 RepID=A0ABT9A833_9BACT|nr:hypothetical protein [Hymenobacter sp. M29]MDO7846000.1 hypothetical protein [Hymenobacter sp. M29]
MKPLLSSFALLCLLLSPSVKAQVLTLDQLFWLRSRSEGDNSEWLTIEHKWHFGKSATIADSLYYSTSWFFQDAHKKRLAALVYESRGSSNVTTISYSTINSFAFNAIKTRLAAYKMKYIGQKNVKGVVWSYYGDDDFDITLSVSSNPKVASVTWHTIVVRPRWH